MKHILKQFTQRDADPFIQFMKYAIAGGLATAVDMGIFYFLSFNVLNALKPDDIVVTFFNLDVPLIEETIRARNFVLNSAIAFVFSNTTAYIINFTWVFHPGRHSRHMEILLFFVVSLVSIFAAVLVGWIMIDKWGLSTSLSYVAKMVCALMINYACRKFLVFKG